MRKIVTLLNLFALSLTLMLFTGCGESLPSVPKTPDGAVQAVAAGLDNNDPSVAWAAMPESYRKDVTDVVHAAAAKMPEDVYDKSFVVLGKATKLAKEKKQFLLNSPLMSMVPADRAKLEANWDAFVDVLTTISNCEVNKLEGLRTVNLDTFIMGTGRKLMADIAKLSAAMRQDVVSQFKDIKVKLISQEGDKATVEVTNAKGRTTTDQMVRVEGRWVPEDMARDWAKNIAEAKKNIAEMTPEKINKDKIKIMGALGMAEGALDALLATKTQEEFNQTLAGVIGGPASMNTPPARPMPRPDSMNN